MILKCIKTIIKYNNKNKYKKMICKNNNYTLIKLLNNPNNNNNILPIHLFKTNIIKVLIEIVKTMIKI